MNLKVKEIEKLIINALEVGRKPKVIRSKPKCLVDDANAYYVVELADILHQLKGETIKDIRWINRLEFESNPDGTIGHFEITLE